MRLEGSQSQNAAVAGEARSDRAAIVLAGTLEEAGTAFCSRYGREKGGGGPSRKRGTFSPLSHKQERFKDIMEYWDGGRLEARWKITSPSDCGGGATNASLP